MKKRQRKKINKIKLEYLENKLKAHLFSVSVGHKSMTNTMLGMKAAFEISHLRKRLGYEKAPAEEER